MNKVNQWGRSLEAEAFDDLEKQLARTQQSLKDLSVLYREMKAELEEKIRLTDKS